MSQVYAAGSEDMDTLTFNAPILFRHLTFSEAKKAPISEINLEKVLEGLEMDMYQVRIIFRHRLIKELISPRCNNSLLTCVYYSDAIIWSL